MATHQRILDAARTAFAERGFNATSLRTIGEAAGVDPALCIHYFGSKAELFAASVEMPFDPADVLTEVNADPSSAGRRLAETFLGALEDEQTRQSLVGLVRSAASDDGAAERVRALVTERVVGAAVSRLDVDRPDLRATLAGSQLMGLVFARHVVGVEPLASASTEEVVAAIAPTLQRYLTEELS